MSTLLQITDCHLPADGDAAHFGVRPARTLRGVIAAARAAHADISAVVATGDIAQDPVPETYACFRDAVGVFGCPVYCLPGNHDDRAVMEAVFAGSHCRLVPAADWQGCRLVFLDTAVPGFEAGALDPAAVAALPDTLADGVPALVFLHHHPRPVGSAWIDRIGLANADVLAAALAGHDNVRAVTCGHVHQAGSGPFAGTICHWTPSTCIQFLPGAETFGCDTRPPGWRWFRCGDGGAIATGVSWLAESQAAPAPAPVAS